MENIRPGKRTLADLPIFADMLNHHAEIGFHVDEKLGDLVEAPFERIQARRQRLTAACDWLACSRLPDPVEHLVKVLWLPAERYGQRFQRARATAALDGVTLDLSDGRQRHMRTFRKFALSPSKLIYTLIDGLGDCRPILRHPFPPRSASAQRLADHRHSAARHGAYSGAIHQKHLCAS